MSTLSLYHAVMGDEFNGLADPVREFHEVRGHHEFHGEVQVEAPISPTAKFLALLLGAPSKASRGPIRFYLMAEPDQEVWTRIFPGKVMCSKLRRSGDRITEQLGPFRLTFKLLLIENALEMQLEKLHLLGIRCPTWLMPDVMAREFGEGAKLHFHISASTPFTGLVTSYSGYLHIPAKALG